MPITGERVNTPAGGFNPTWQRHVAAYALCAPFLPPGRVLDLGCGVGHSYALLAPRETVGLDVDAAALADQHDRETVAADMREIPFGPGSFASALSVHSLEHVPDPERVLAEVRRTVAPGGVAVFVTPNRLTFAHPDEVIDPYHYFEVAPEELRTLCAGTFAAVELHGIFGSPRYRELLDRQNRTLDRLLAADPLRLRRRVSRRTRQRLYDHALTWVRRGEDPAAAAIDVDDFSIGAEGLDSALDLVAVCR